MEDKKMSQKIKGSKNVQVGINSGKIITTNKIVEKVNVTHDMESHITDEQAKEIQDKVNELVKTMTLEGTSIPRLYAQEWTAFKNKFKVTSYKLLPKNKFDEAIVWFQKRDVYAGRPKLRKKDTTAWRNKHYKGIFARSR